MESNTYPKGNIMTATDIFAGTNDMEHLSAISRTFVRQMIDKGFTLTAKSSIEILTNGSVRETLDFTSLNGVNIAVVMFDGVLIEHRHYNEPLPITFVNAYFDLPTTDGEFQANQNFRDNLAPAAEWDELADEYAMLDEWWHDMRNWFPTEAWERYRELGSIMFA